MQSRYRDKIKKKHASSSILTSIHKEMNKNVHRINPFAFLSTNQQIIIQKMRISIKTKVEHLARKMKIYR